MNKDFVKVKVHVGTRTFTHNHTIRMEKGCLFQNNGGQYIVDNNGELKFRKDENSPWEKVDRIDMTKYQWSVFQNLIDNDENVKTYSKEDIMIAWKKYKAGGFCDDLSDSLPDGYRIERNDAEQDQRPRRADDGAREKWVEAYVGFHGANGQGDLEIEHSARLRFQIAEIEAMKAASIEYKKAQQDPVILVPQVLTDNILNADGRNVYIDFQPASTYTVKAGDSIEKIIRQYGIDYYELFAVNPQLKYNVTYSPTNQAIIDLDGYIHDGDQINIPARYKIKPGSVRTLQDVVKATGVTEEYLRNIILQMEPDKPGVPDLIAYNDGVNGKGALTIGFGHTGRFLDNRPLTKNTEITEEEAYEILAQDILNNKVRTIAYFEQNGIPKADFDRIPQSLQSVLIDIPFNKGVFDGFENPYHDYTIQLKEDLINKDYAAATMHTIRLSNVAGLEKRSMYRLIVAMEGLDNSDFNRVINDVTVISEMERVIQRLRSKGHLSEANKLKHAWDNVGMALY